MHSELILDGNDFHDLNSFYSVIYGLMNLYPDWMPAHNLDALNDMMYSGFGKEPVKLIWCNSEKSKNDLGLEATVEFYRNKINQGKPFNIELLKEKISGLENGSGQTLFEIILEIFREQPHIELILD